MRKKNKICLRYLFGFQVDFFGPNFFYDIAARSRCFRALKKKGNTIFNAVGPHVDFAD